MKKKIETVLITTPFIKLDQFLKLSGVAESGGQAKIMITEGDIMVNSLPCEMRGKKLKNGDTVTTKECIYKISLKEKTLE